MTSSSRFTPPGYVELNFPPDRRREWFDALMRRAMDARMRSEESVLAHVRAVCQVNRWCGTQIVSYWDARVGMVTEVNICKFPDLRSQHIGQHEHAFMRAVRLWMETEYAGPEGDMRVKTRVHIYREVLGDETLAS